MRKNWLIALAVAGIVVMGISMYLLRGPWLQGFLLTEPASPQSTSLKYCCEGNLCSAVAAPYSCNGTVYNDRLSCEIACNPDTVCGDGMQQQGEICDDGNTVNCDGCKGDCSRYDKVCGDLIQECGEECDDGNTVSQDGCSAACKKECTRRSFKCGSWPEFPPGSRWKDITTYPKIILCSSLPAVCPTSGSNCPSPGTTMICAAPL